MYSAASHGQAGWLLLQGKWINFLFSLSGARQQGAVWPSLSEAGEQKRDSCSPSWLAARAPSPLESITNHEIVLCLLSLQCVPLSAAPPLVHHLCSSKNLLFAAFCGQETCCGLTSLV